jgi:hypothetical protein
MSPLERRARLVGRSALLPSWLCALALALGSTSGASAQNVWIVDAAGGRGTHFQDLPAAVAAVADGDILRVRPGIYSPFTMIGKGLRILGEDAATVSIRGAGAMTIGSTSPGQTIWMQDIALRLSASASAPAATLRVEDAAGSVVLQRVRIEPEGMLPPATPAASPLLLRRCAQVHVLEVHVESFVRRGAGASPGAAAIDAQDCALEIASSVVYGGPAASGSAPAAGGAALVVQGGQVFAARSMLLGGLGSVGCAATQLVGGNGGAGIEASGGAELLLAGRVQHLQIGVQGGDGGADCSILGPYQGNGGHGIDLRGAHARVEGLAPAGGRGRVPGSPFTAQGGATYAQQPQAAPALASVIGTPRPRSTVLLSLEAGSGSLAFLMLSLEHAFLPLPAPDFGVLLIAPSPAPWIGVQVLVGPSWTIPIDLTPVWQRNLTVIGQYLSFDGTRLYASNTIALTVLSS